MEDIYLHRIRSCGLIGKITYVYIVFCSNMNDSKGSEANGDAHVIMQFQVCFHLPNIDNSDLCCSLYLFVDFVYHRGFICQ